MTRTLMTTAFLFGPALVPPAFSQPPLSNPAKAWEFSASALAYLVPDETNYLSPTFRADRNWLHLEARYNYEDQRTGSAWLGYNFSAGNKLIFEVTPMVGAVFGRTTGVAPGALMSLAYKKFDLSSENEYVVAGDNGTADFFYTWSELGYSPLKWLRLGLVAQRTRAYQTPLDVQRGFSVGVSRKNWNFTAYIFNAGWTDPTAVLATTFSF